MTLEHSYGPLFYVPFKAADGAVYRVTLLINGLPEGGPTSDLELLGRAACRAKWGVDGGAATALDCLRAVMPFSLEITVRPQRRGQLGFLVGRAAGEIMALLEVGDQPVFEDVTTWAEVGRGFLVQERLVDVPSDALSGIRLRFHDGLRFLLDRAFAGPDTDFHLFGVVPDDHTFLVSLARCLGPLGGEVAAATWQGWNAAAALVTSTDWRPWRPGGAGAQITASQDPVHYIRSLASAWTDEDDASVDQQAAVRSLAARLLARLTQCDGGWHLVQRDLVAADPTAVPTWTYPAGDAYGIDYGSGTRTVRNLVVDTHGWVEGARAPREMTLGVRSIASGYSIDPPLESYLLNPSFEEAGATAAEAEHWTFSGNEGGGQRLEADDAVLPFGSGFSGFWVAQVYGYGPTEDPTHLVQEDKVFLPASSGWRFSASWTLGIVDTGGIGGADFVSYQGVLFKIGSYYLNAGTATAAAAHPAGRNVRVYVAPLLTGVTGHVVGAEVLPEGTALAFRGGGALTGTLTLTKPAKVGDIVLYGDLDGDVGDGDEAAVFYWKTGSGSPVQNVTSADLVDHNPTLSLLFTSQVQGGGTAIDGTRVSGYLSWTVIGPELDTNGEGLNLFAVYDEFDLDISLTGSDADLVAAVVSGPLGTSGDRESIPAHGGEHPVGDGPVVTSESGLLSGTQHDTRVPTYQGEDTGWIKGVHGAASTGVGLEEFAGRRALMQVLEPLEVVRPTFHLMPADGSFPPHRLRPYDVIKYWQDAELAAYHATGLETIMITGPVRPGATVILSRGRAEEETVTVADDDGAGGPAVVPGPGYYTAHLAAPTTETHFKNAPCWYSLLAWPDTLDWLVDEGVVHVDATELRLVSDAAFIVEHRLGRET